MTLTLEAPRISFIPAGPTPPNPAELVGSARMRDALEELRDQYDFIILDSPPVLPVTDAVVLAREVDGVVQVVKGHDTPRELIRRARDQLVQANAHLLGAVINNVDLGWGDLYFYNRYYGYYRQPTRGGGTRMSAVRSPRPGRLAGARRSLVPLLLGGRHAWTVPLAGPVVLALLVATLRARQQRGRRPAAHRRRRARRVRRRGARHDRSRLPPALLRLLSPATARLYADMLPGWPGGGDWSALADARHRSRTASGSSSAGSRSASASSP